MISRRPFAALSCGLLLASCGSEPVENFESEDYTLEARRGSEVIASFSSPVLAEIPDAVPLVDMQGWGVPSKKWNPPVIQVCWENPDPRHGNERQIVEAALTNSWEAESSVDFRGFQTCSPGAAGVHVGVTDGIARTQGTGVEVDRKAAGMLLNFNYATWHPECRQSEVRRLNCVRANAIHEFGHVIGLVHEHNRHDTPDDCEETPDRVQGEKILTPWDPDSVMNYCNRNRWLDGGKLSLGDVSSVQQMYGSEI